MSQRIKELYTAEGQRWQRILFLSLASILCSVSDLRKRPEQPDRARISKTHGITYPDTTRERIMEGLLHSQVTQVPLNEGTHTVPLKKLFEQLESSEQGLTSAEASKRLDTYGPNDTTGLKRTSPVVQFLRLFLNPLVAILLVASVVSAILGDRVNASIIMVIVLLSNILNFVQTSRSQNAVEKLRADVAPTATVLRDGTWL